MKKILLVADIKGWIFERHCEEIKKRLSHKYQMDIAFCRGCNIGNMSSDYDLVYVLDPMPINYPPQSKTVMGLRAEFLFLDHPQGPKGLYEHGFPGKTTSSIKDRCVIFHVVNKNMFKLFNEFVTDKPVLLVQHGVDETCFDRDKYPRTEHPFTVGFSGRFNHPNKKGVQLVLDACQKAQVPFATAQYGKKKLNKDQMPDFYTQVDVYACLSETEGLNNSTMEAGLMGIPTISSKCGAAEEMIVDGESGLIVERSVEAVAEAIEKMKEEAFRFRLGEAMYDTIKTSWTWETKIKEYENMFDMYFEMQI